MGLVEKLKNMKAETKKRIIAAALAGGVLAATGVGVASCVNNANNPSSGSTITDPSDSNGSSGGNASSNNNSNKYSKYSTILQGVMTKNVYEVYKTWGNNYLNTRDEDLVMNNNRFLPIPYKFLEDLGYDRESVARGSHKARAEIFRIDNDLYVALGIQALSKADYMINYLLKYNVTDQEIDEMDKLFYTREDTFNNYTYFQAPFFVQELSYARTPEVLNVSYQATDTQSAIIHGLEISTHIHSLKDWSKKNILMLNFERNNDYWHQFDCVVWPASINAHGKNLPIGVMTIGGYYGTSDRTKIIEGHEVLLKSSELAEPSTSPYYQNGPMAYVDSYSSSDFLFDDLTLHSRWEKTFNEKNPF